MIALSNSVYMNRIYDVTDKDMHMERSCVKVTFQHCSG